MRTLMGSRLRFVQLALALFVAIAAFFAVAVLPNCAYADDNPKATVERWNKQGGYSGVEKYSDIAAAFKNVKAWGNNSNTSTVSIHLYDDFNSNSYGVIEFVGGATYYLYLHGHMINRDESDSTYYGSGDGEVLYVKDGSKLTINGGSQGEESLTKHPGYCVVDSEGGYLWQDGSGVGLDTPLYGGVITGGACDSGATAGGIAVSGSNAELHLNNVTIAGNVADTSIWKSSSGYAGGVGIWGADSVLEMDNAKICYNSAEMDGGGLYICRKTQVTMKNGSQIHHNRAVRQGAGVYVEGNETNFTVKGGSEISYNYSKEYGGGVVMHAKDATLTLDNSKINNNQTPKRGGGIYASYSNVTVVLKNHSQMTKNDCQTFGGGAIYADEKYFKLELYNSEIVSNSTCGLYIDAGKATVNILENSKLSDNYSYGIYYSGSDGSINIKDSVFSNNGSYYSAGIYNKYDGTTINIINSKLYGNTGGGADGGALHLEDETTLNIKDSEIYDNRAERGGAIYVADLSTINMDNSHIYNNHSSDATASGDEEGGGICFKPNAAFSSGTMTLNMENGSSIYGNNTDGVYNEDYDLRIISKDRTGSIHDNTTGTSSSYDKRAYNGAGICSRNGSLYVEGISITGNKIGGDGWLYGEGGGVYVKDPSSFTLRDVTITGNVSRQGGGLFFQSSKYRNFTMQGKVVIDDNETLYRWIGDWGATTFTEKNANNVYLSSSSQTICGGDSDDTYLKPTSHIGITGEYGSLPRQLSGNQAFVTKIKDSYKQVLFSDVDNRTVELDGNYLYLKNGEEKFDLTIVAANGTTTKEKIGRSNKVELKSADYPKYVDADDQSKGTYLLDYWTLESPNAATKTVKTSAGTAMFFMPYGDTTATAHYTTDITGVQLGLEESSGDQDNLGKKENVSISSLTLTDCEDKASKVSESLLKDLTVESCKAADGTGSDAGLKKVTYVVKIPASVFEKLDIPVSSERVSSAVAAVVASSLGSKEDNACKVEAADGGLKVTATVAFGEQRTITVKGLDVNKVSAAGADPTIDGVTSALKVADGASATIALPKATGWNFTKWDIPEGTTATVDGTSNSVTLTNVTQDVTLDALYEPFVSAVDINISVPEAGGTLPKVLTSCRVTGTSFSGLDVTNSINKYGLEVVWKEKGSETALPEDYQVKADTEYVATATVTLGADTPATDQGGTQTNVATIMDAANSGGTEVAYSYAFADNISVAVNGIAAITKRDAGAHQAVVTFSIKTGQAKGFDHIVTDLSDVKVVKKADSSEYLPGTIEVALDKEGTSRKSCAATWEDLKDVKVSESDEFTVKGTFSYNGVTYNVSRAFRLTDIGAPAASIDSGTYEKGQKLSLLAGAGWSMGSDDVSIKYCLVSGEQEKPAADAKYSDYTADDPIVLNASGTYTLFAYGQVGERVTEFARYVYTVKARSAIEVLDGEAYVGGDIVTEALEGDTVTIKANDPAKRKKFASWKILDGSAVELANADAQETTFTMPGNDVSLEATYEASSYLVTFDTGDWTSKIASQEVKVGGKATKPVPDPERTNCEFQGWYANEACTGDQYDFDTALTGDITLYAKWKVNRYLVTFLYNDENDTRVDEQVVCNECVAEPDTPKRNGYEFGGWQLDGKAYNFNEPVTQNITLTATWYVIDDTEYAKSLDIELPEIIAGSELPATAKVTLSRYYGKQTQVVAQLTWSTLECEAVEAGTKAKGGTNYVVEASIAPSINPAVEYRSTMLVTFNGKSALGVSVGKGSVLEATYGFTVAAKSIKKAELSLSKTKCAYDKNGCTPAVTLRLDGKELVLGSDFEVRYQGSTEVGRAYAIVTGCGDYTGTLVAAYKIIPTKVKGIKAKAKGAGKVKVSWTKHKAQTDSFQVRYAASKAALKAGKGKTIKVKGAGKKSLVIKGLKSGKRCYVQVRACKTAVGKTYRSAWSKVRSAKVK